MKKLYNIYLPTLSKKTVDFRKWYYVYINGEIMPWWCLKWEKEIIINDYKNDKVIFKKVPFYKRIIL